MRSIARSPRVPVLILLGLAALGLARAADPAADQLRLVVILTRHGVRSPLSDPQRLATFAARPWPKWDVAPGIQTEHGNFLIGQMAEYYRSRFTEAGLLSGDPAKDAPGVFVRADNDQRTEETGRIIGRALSGVADVDVHALPDGTKDPLFRTLETGVGRFDREKALAAVLGRLGGDTAALNRAIEAPLARLKAILYGPNPPSNTPLDGPVEFLPGADGNPIKSNGPLIPALVSTESFILEYVQGMPDSDVGWGQVDGRTLTDFFALHDLFFQLLGRTPYLAQASASDLADHIVDTLEQGALEAPVPGAIGPDGEKVVVLVGHDTNIATVGGLLGLDWMIPGTQADPVLPGGALVFELWKKGGQESAYFVRVSYTCQSLETMRRAAPGKTAEAPVRCPIFVPEASDAGPRYDAPLAAFVRHARKVIDPSFITQEP